MFGKKKTRTTMMAEKRAKNFASQLHCRCYDHSFFYKDTSHVYAYHTQNPCHEAKHTQRKSTHTPLQPSASESTFQLSISTCCLHQTRRAAQRNCPPIAKFTNHETQPYQKRTNNATGVITHSTLPPAFAVEYDHHIQHTSGCLSYE